MIWQKSWQTEERKAQAKRWSKSIGHWVSQSKKWSKSNSLLLRAKPYCHNPITDCKQMKERFLRKIISHRAHNSHIRRSCSKMKFVTMARQISQLRPPTTNTFSRRRMKSQDIIPSRTIQISTWTRSWKSLSVCNLSMVNMSSFDWAVWILIPA